MRMPSHTALCSLVFSTILTSALIPSTGNVSLAAAGAPAVQMAVHSALNGLRTQGFAGASEVALPALASSPAAATPAPATAANPALSAETLGKMIEYTGSKGVVRDMPARFANALGLTAAGQGWSAHQVLMKMLSSDLRRGFGYANGNDQDIVFSQVMPGSVRAYRARRDGKIITATVWDRSTDEIATLDRAAAQSDLDAEIVFWTANIDHFLAGN